MKIVKFVLDVPFEACFRKRGESNHIRTYPIPPVTSIHGLVCSAMARPSHINNKDEQEFRRKFCEKTFTSIKVEESGIKAQNLKTRMKRVGKDKNETGQQRYVIKEETLISPTYKVRIGSEDENLLEDIKSALETPRRPLYLGRSDDMVDVREVRKQESSIVKDNREVECVIPGFGKETEVLPIIPDMKNGNRKRQADVEMVSVYGGEVEEYFKDENEEEFYFIDRQNS